MCDKSLAVSANNDNKKICWSWIKISEIFQKRMLYAPAADHFQQCTWFQIFLVVWFITVDGYPSQSIFNNFFNSVAIKTMMVDHNQNLINCRCLLEESFTFPASWCQLLQWSILVFRTWGLRRGHLHCPGSLWTRSAFPSWPPRSENWPAIDKIAVGLYVIISIAILMLGIVIRIPHTDA